MSLKCSSTTGHLLDEPSGHLVKECNICIAGVAFANGLRIKSYSDSLFTPCSICAGSVLAAWDGKFTYWAGGPFDACGFLIPSTYSINGKLLSYTPSNAIYYYSVISAVPFLKLICTDSSYFSHTIWYGFSSSSAWTGTYVYESGCSSGISTLEVEAIP